MKLEIGKYYEFDFLGFTVVGKYLGMQQRDDFHEAELKTFYIYADEFDDDRTENYEGRKLEIIMEVELRNIKKLKNEEVAIRILELRK